ncbi:hypothetical protein C1X64_12750 [Pseudomonas sp. GW456-E7]|nr:hypothetical protein C1X64_12750 [Pseudomonas sp. GW456-E7]
MVGSSAPDPASSRASPLPHLTELIQETAVECGSGLAREDVIPDNTHIKPKHYRSPVCATMPGRTQQPAARRSQHGPPV